MNNIPPYFTHFKKKYSQNVKNVLTFTFRGVTIGTDRRKMMRTLSGIDVANNIRAERNRVNMTQEEVASKLGISLKTYIAYEDDAKSIKATMLYSLSVLFNCNIENFYIPSNFTKCVVSNQT